VPRTRGIGTVATQLTWLVPVLALAASLAGLLIDGIYTGAVATAEMFRGYDLVTAVVVGAQPRRRLSPRLVRLDPGTACQHQPARLPRLRLRVRPVLHRVQRPFLLHAAVFATRLGMALDLALLVPLYAVAAVLLWRRLRGATCSPPLPCSPVFCIRSATS
jgi:hypothetical protein